MTHFSKFSIIARMKNPSLFDRLFSKKAKSRVVFDITEKYTDWDDPSYGNGCGMLVERTRVIATYESEVEAIHASRMMNHWDGKK